VPTAQVGLASEERSTAGTLAKSEGRVRSGGLPRTVREQVGIFYLRWLSSERMEISVEEAREKFPELITLVEGGELITITRNEIPVADLMPSLAREG
jgi:hypothetical protein